MSDPEEPTPPSSDAEAIPREEGDPSDPAATMRLSPVELVAAAAELRAEVEKDLAPRLGGANLEDVTPTGPGLGVTIPPDGIENTPADAPHARAAREAETVVVRSSDLAPAEIVHEAAPPSVVVPRLPAPKLVGRGPLLAELETLAVRVAQGEGSAQATIIGAPGLGKTRLVDEVVKRSPEYRVVRIDAAGSSAAEIVEGILRRRLDLSRQLRGDALRNAFDTAVRRVLGGETPDEFLHFLGAYLDIPPPEGAIAHLLHEEEPERQHRIARAVLRRFLAADAREEPILLVAENVHDAKDDALDLLEALATGVPAKTRIFILVTARPELIARRHTWLAGTPRFELEALHVDDAGQLALRLFEPLGEIPDELVDAAVEASGGNPYLLVQMVRSFFEAGALRVDEEDESVWHVDLDQLENASLPMDVESAVHARVAALTPGERELLERAAAVGHVFWIGALVALGRIDERAPELWGGSGSARTVDRELLLSLAEREYVAHIPDSSLAGEDEFIFRHPLERELLRARVPPERLARYQSHTAEWLEFRMVQRSESMLERVAQHFEEAGLAERAATRWLELAERARERFANARAAESFERGLALLGTENLSFRLEALHGYGDVLTRLGHMDEAHGAFREMLDVAYRLGLRGKGGAAHNRIGRLHRAVGQLEEAMRHLGTGQALFVGAQDERGVASSLDDIGKVHWMRGNYPAAERFMREALARREQLGDPRSLALSYNNLGMVLQDSGRTVEAQSAFARALELWGHVSDLAGTAQTLNNLGRVLQDRDDHAGALQYYEQALQAARSVGDRMREAAVLTNLGETHYRLGAPEEAIETLKIADLLARTMGDRILTGEVLRGLAKARMLTEDLRGAQEAIAEAVQLLEAAGSLAFLATAVRTRAEIAAASGWGEKTHEEATASFERSLELFEELGHLPELIKTLHTYRSFLAEQLRMGEGDPERLAALERRLAELQVRSYSPDDTAGFAMVQSAELELAETGGGGTETTKVAALGEAAAIEAELLEDDDLDAPTYVDDPFRDPPTDRD